MTNRHRCEVPFSKLGEGLFIRFSLADLSELESEFGVTFFDEIETACSKFSPTITGTCLRIGLKRKGDGGHDIRVFSDIDWDKAQEDGYTVGDAAKPILEAIAQSWLNKSYDQLIKEAEEARKARDQAQRDAIQDAIKEASEAAKEANLPFDDEALSKMLSNMLTGLELTQQPSGD